MDMRSLIEKMDQLQSKQVLNEGKEPDFAPSYRVGKTSDFGDKPHMKRGTPVAGKLGKYGKTSDELSDPDQDDDVDIPAASGEKRGRGRPRKAGSEADTKGKYSGAAELQRWIVGSIPNGKLPGKKGRVHKSPQDKEEMQEAKMNRWFEKLQLALNEAEQITMEPAKQDTQVLKQGDKVLGSVSNPALAATIKAAIGKGEMSLAGDHMMEDDIEESGLQAYLGNKKYGKEGMDALRKAGRDGASKEKMASIRAKYDKLDEEDMAEGRVDQLPTRGADYSKYDTDHLKILLRPGILHRNEARFKALIRKELKKREQQDQQGVAEGDDRTVANIKNYERELAKYKKFNANGAHDVKIKNLEKIIAYLKSKQGVAEGSLEEYGDTAKGQKMLGKVHNRAADRVTSKQADKDPEYARKAQQTQDRAWERLAVKEQGVAEGFDDMIGFMTQSEEYLAKQSPQLQQLIALRKDPKYQTPDAKKGLEARIKQQMDRISLDKGEVMGPDGKPVQVKESEKWIQKAIKHPGALKKQLGVPADEKIPAGKLEKATHAKGKLGQRARLAKTLRGMNEADIPPRDGMESPFSGSGRNPTTLESKTSARDDRAERAGRKVTKDLEYDMYHHGKDDNKAERAGKKVTKDIEWDEKHHHFNEEKTVTRDNRAEKAGRKVTKDIEYDEKVKDNIHGKKRGSEDNKAERAGRKVTKDIEYDEKKLPSMAHIKKMCKDGKTVAQICKMHPNCNQTELKKMIADCKKKMIKEGMDHMLHAARLEGKSHALRKMPYNCTHDDMEEARHYHDGYKEGLDECYDMVPIRGIVGEESDDIVDSMASYGARGLEEDDLDEVSRGEYMKQKARTTPGDTFKAFGQTFHDSDVLDEFAFESLDKQLNELLNEGISVSISQGQHGAPNSVNVNATDAEADTLLDLVKQAGLGIFGGSDEQPAAKDSSDNYGKLDVADDHDAIISLIRKMTGGAHDHEEHEEEEQHHGDHEHGEICSECGSYMEEGHSCGQEMVGETETADERLYQVAEDETEVQQTAASEKAQSTEDAALAQAAGQNFADTDSNADTNKDPVDESWANSTDDGFEADINFMTKMISGGLNKQKSTGQTTIPVIAGQNDRMGYSTNESVDDWKKLAGIR